MALSPALLIASTQLANAVASVGGPLTPAHWLIQRAVFTNVDTAARTITVHRVPAAGTPAAANEVIGAFVLNAVGQSGHTYTAPELAGMVLNPGDTLQAFADVAAKVNITVSGFTY